MRTLIVTASLASLLTAASGALAAEPINASSASKLGHEVKSPAAIGEVKATDIKSTMAHVPEASSPSGFKSAGASRLVGSGSRAPQSRLTGITRMTPIPGGKNFGAGATHTAPAGDVPLSVVKREVTAAPRTAGAKMLSAPTGPAIQRMDLNLSHDLGKTPSL